MRISQCPAFSETTTAVLSNQSTPHSLDSAGTLSLQPSPFTSHMSGGSLATPTSSQIVAAQDSKKRTAFRLHLTPPRGSRLLRLRSAKVLLAILLPAIFVSIVCTVYLSNANDDRTVESVVSETRLAKNEEWVSSMAVAVAHTPSRLAMTAVMQRTQLPSWTLRHVEAECAECLDSETHAAAVQRQGGAAGAAVFATAAAPLGIAGPMLLAMASVTDDVDGAAELARWSWVPRSYAMRRQFSGASPAGLRGGTSPYLVVLGIPSTDQPVRATLRDAQRATWLSFREVARSGNDFRGALLPLYLFAAAERELTSGVTDVSPLLPTVAEYEAASVARLNADNESGEVPDYGVRRVVTSLGAFRDRLLSAEQLLESPCTSIAARTVDGDTDRKSTWLVKLTSGLELPATPAAVAPAQFICHASAALWQEVLRYRNAVWIDMMTDRKPTSKKKLGEGGDWGLPVEVGMSQKLILWLHYAYHAFPDVPYIMKGDDDTYLKVPQFLHDIRHIRSGFRHYQNADEAAVRDGPGVSDTERCIYWGTFLRNDRWGFLSYHGGSGYLLHRRVVQALLEMRDPSTVEMVRLASNPFDPELSATYYDLLMNYEDVFVGSLVRSKRARLHEICPAKKAWFVEESFPRFIDTHMPDRRIGYAGLVIHHVTPFDIHYLHYFFQNEFQASLEIEKGGESVEKEVIAKAEAYMSTRVPSSMYGYGRYNQFAWKHPANMPSSYQDEADNVRVYNIRYLHTSFRSLDATFESDLPENSYFFSFFFLAVYLSVSPSFSFSCCVCVVLFFFFCVHR